MKKIVSALAFFTILSLSAQDVKKIFGKVSDGNNPMSNVNISVLNGENATTTTEDGSYEIYAKEGDKLEFSYTGMRTISIRIEDVTRVLNPIMIPDVQELDEVVVEGSRRRSQKDLEEDYPISKSIIRTAWGYLDTKRSPGQAWLMSEDDINPIRVCILDLLQNRFPGVQVIGDCFNGGAVTSRRYSSITQGRGFIFDVDGQIFTDAPIWIPVQNMKRIAIFPGLSMAVRYGSIGGGGVVVINTINGNPQIDKIVDRARLKNNFATDKVLTKEEIAKNLPSYQKEYDASDSFESAKEVFDSHNNKYASSPYFFIDSYRYFHDQWGATDFADGIIEENFSNFEENAVLLKALAYTYEEQGRYEKANDTYKEIFILRPNYAQSYFDMANSYRNVKQPRQAASMYARYGYLLEQSFMEFDTIGFGPIINREYNNLLLLDKEAVVESKKVKKIKVENDDFDGTRLVFEWNDSEAEFEMQFVNPGNQYHAWKHTLADNSETIYREKDFGYNINEYLIDGSLPGTWKVNVKYLGNKSLSPTYLKATIYYNYGRKSQRKEVKVFKLSLKDVNHELFKLSVAGTIN